MRNRAKAKFEAETRIINADAEAYETEKTGAAAAMVIKLKEAAPLQGRALGLSDVAKVLQDQPEAREALAADTARELMERAHVIFAGGAENSIRDLMAGGSAVKHGMDAAGNGGTRAKSS